MDVKFWILIGFLIILGIGLIAFGIWGRKNAFSKLQESYSSELLYAGIAITIFVGAGLLFSHIEQLKKISETQLETEVTREVDAMTENIAYANGEIVDKQDNNVILVTIHEENYKIMVEQDVYDTVSIRDMISCVLYLDKNNNIVGVNYFAR